MPDREKIIGLLQETAEYFRECRNNASFASKAENHFWELQNAANEAIELLKEQEEVEPEIQTGSGVSWWYICGNCKEALNPKDKFCHECGRCIKWE